MTNSILLFIFRILNRTPLMHRCYSKNLPFEMATVVIISMFITGIVTTYLKSLFLFCIIVAINIASMWIVMKYSIYRKEILQIIRTL